MRTTVVSLTIIVGIVASVVVAVINRNIFAVRFEDYSDDAEFYNNRALSFVHDGSLHEEQAFFRRPPLYPLFLALAYRTLGERPQSAWVFQAALFACILALLLSISEQMMTGPMVFVPPFLTASYWGVNFYVFKIGSEILALFLLIAATWSLMKYERSRETRTLIVSGTLFAFLILTKPIVLYFVAILLIFLYGGRPKISPSSLLLFAAPVLLIVGGWSIHTYVLFGEFQAERSGHILYTRALHAALPLRDIGAHGVAALTGDYVASIVFPRYGDDSVPMRLGLLARSATRRLVESGASPNEAEGQLLRTGLDLITKHPIGYALGTVPLFFDLHVPENIRGFPINRMFVRTHDSLTLLYKLALMFTVRAVWLLFLLCVGIGVWGYTKARGISFPALFIALFVAAHILLIVPAEPRFLLPVLPFYFIFFTIAVSRLRRAGNLLLLDSR